MKFPPEEVESRRWQKIADELGNRTAKQVLRSLKMNRQQYFLSYRSMTPWNLVKNQASAGHEENNEFFIQFSTCAA